MALNLSIGEHEVGQANIEVHQTNGLGLTVAYWIAWHNVYNQRIDSKDSIEFHQESSINESNERLYLKSSEDIFQY